MKGKMGKSREERSSEVWLLCPNLSEASVRLGHKSLRTLMKRSSSWYLPGGNVDLFIHQVLRDFLRLLPALGGLCLLSSINRVFFIHFILLSFK